MARSTAKSTSKSIANTIAEECLAARIRLLNRTITSIYDEALRPLGSTVGQLNILVAVAKLGPLSPGDVSRRLNMEKSTVSRNVERLRNNGWIKVLPGESGRTQMLEVSAKGHRLLEKAAPYWKEAQEQTVAVLGQRGAQAVRRAADALWAQLGLE
jgi:DNA-binding MarR family transcriptional regulator